MKTVECRSPTCRATIVKAVHEGTGNVSVFDAAPIPPDEAKMLASTRGLYELVERDDQLPLARRATVLVGVRLYRSHFATCPDAGWFRKGTRS